MKNALNNKAFTLFELIIVVLLISIVYGVFVHKLSTQKQEDKPVSIENLRSWLGGFSFEKNAKIVCFKENLGCVLFLDANMQEGEFKLFEDEIAVYELDETGRPKIISFDPYFNQNGKPQDVFFEFSLRKNGSGSSFIIDREGVFYVFQAISKTPQIFQTFEGAKEGYDHYELLPILTSDYQY